MNSKPLALVVASSVLLVTGVVALSITQGGLLSFNQDANQTSTSSECSFQVDTYCSGENTQIDSECQDRLFSRLEAGNCENPPTPEESDSKIACALSDSTRTKLIGPDTEDSC